jgi:hypothetical protein
MVLAAPIGADARNQADRVTFRFPVTEQYPWAAKVAVRVAHDSVPAWIDPMLTKPDGGTRRADCGHAGHRTADSRRAAPLLLEDLVLSRHRARRLQSPESRMSRQPR